MLTCLTCKTEFEPKRKTQVTCSKECATAEDRRKARVRSAQKREHMPWHNCDICGASLEGQHRQRKRCRGECEVQFRRNWQREAYKDPRVKERVREYGKRYHVENAAAVSERSRAAYERDRPQYLARVKDYKLRNPELVASWNRNRRARAAGAGAERYTLEDVLATYGPICHLCGTGIDLGVARDSPLAFTFDHVTPIVRGGSDVLSNIRPAHRVCNLRKSSKLLQELDLPFPAPVSETEVTAHGGFSTPGDRMDS